MPTFARRGGNRKTRKNTKRKSKRRHRGGNMGLMPPMHMGPMQEKEKEKEGIFSGLKNWRFHLKNLIHGSRGEGSAESYVGTGGRKHKSRKHKSNKHKSNKHKSRKHKSRKHKSRKHKSRKHKC